MSTLCSILLFYLCIFSVLSENILFNIIPLWLHTNNFPPSFPFCNQKISKVFNFPSNKSIITKLLYITLTYKFIYMNPQYMKFSECSKQLGEPFPEHTANIVPSNMHMFWAICLLQVLLLYNFLGFILGINKKWQKIKESFTKSILCTLKNMIENK